MSISGTIILLTEKKYTMQKLLPLIVFSILLKMLAAQNNHYLPVDEPANKTENTVFPHIYDLAGHNAIDNDSSPQNAHVGQDLTDHQEREKWIRETVIILKKLSGPADEQIIEKKVTELDGFFQAGYRVQGSGYIRFDNGDWIYLVSNSAHDNEKIGDITLAMDNKRRFYINEGHVCGGIIHFVTNDKIAVRAATDFTEHFISDTDDAGWKNLHPDHITSIISRK